jgi:hypothetical protein
VITAFPGNKLVNRGFFFATRMEKYTANYKSLLERIIQAILRGLRILRNIKSLLVM